MDATPWTDGRPDAGRLAEQVVATAADAIITVDSCHRIVAANAAAAALFGYPVEELVGQPLERLLPERAHADHRRYVRQYGRSGDTIRGHGQLGVVHGLRADGTLIALEGAISACEVDGQRYYTVVQRPAASAGAHDATVRRQLELERRMRDVAATAPGVVCSFRLRPDGTACFPYASPRLYGVYGVTPEEVADDAGPIFALVHPDDLAPLHRGIVESSLALSPWLGEYRFQHPTRGLRWIEGHAVPVRDDDGGTLWHGIVTDVTERKQIELALQAARDAEQTAQLQLRATLDAGRIGTWAWDLGSDAVSLDATAASLLGRSHDELRALADVVAHVQVEDRGRVDAALVRARAGVFDSLELRVVRRDGSVGAVVLRGVVERDERGQARRACGAIVDVTDERRSARQRVMVADIDRILAESSSLDDAGARVIRELAIGTGCVLGRLWRVVPGAADVSLAASWRAPESDREGVDAAADLVRAAWAAMEVRCSGTVCAFPLLHRGDVVGVFELCGATSPPAREPETRQLVGSVGHRLGQFIAHRDAEEQIRRFVSLSPNGLYALRLEPAPRITWMSDNAAALIGWAYTGTQDHAWWIERIHPDDRARVIAAHPVPYAVEHQVIEYRFRRRDGRYVWLRDEKRLVLGPGGEPSGEVIGTWADVSERVQLETQLRQAQKMEAIGVLAGGVAHDFNNLLMVISCATDVLQSMIPPNDPRAELLAEITAAGERGVGLTRQLLLFSRTQVVTPRVLDPNQVLSTAEKMLRRLIGEDVVLTTHLAPMVGAIRIDPGQLEQIVLNLVVNARDAMPRGGAMSISSRRIVLDDAAVSRSPGAHPGPHVRIEVTDSGGGIAPEVLTRIFEPFFTTKPDGKGTGLGLATVFGIVQQAGGHIEVTSELGTGSSFAIDLPVVDGTLVAAVVASGSTPGGRERVLLVEDDDRVRRVTRLVLQQHGYQVLEANCAAAAFDVMDRPMGAIDLLITDVVMPGGSGRDVARGLEQRRPGTPVLYMSGYIDDAVLRHGIADRDNFLHKPASTHVLLHKVRELLDRSRTTATATAG